MVLTGKNLDKGKTSSPWIHSFIILFAFFGLASRIMLNQIKNIIFFDTESLKSDVNFKFRDTFLVGQALD